MDAEVSFEELVALMLHVSGHHHFSRFLAARTRSFLERRASRVSEDEPCDENTAAVEQQVQEAAAAAITHYHFTNKAEEVERWRHELEALKLKIKQAEVEL
jgi:hypothetical protein